MPVDQESWLFMRDLTIKASGGRRPSVLGRFVKRQSGAHQEML